MKIAFNDLPSAKDIPEELLGLEVTGRVDSIQDSSQGGLIYSVEIDNPSDSAVVILQPAGLILYQLLDSKGYPVATPAPIPGELINIREEDKAEIMVNEAHEIREVSRNGKPQALQPSINQETIELLPGDQWAYTFLIGRLENGKPLPSGKYQLVLTISLAFRQKVGAANRLMQTKRIPIDFHQA